MFLTTITNCWKTPTWMPWVLRGALPYADCMIVSEGSWILDKGDDPITEQTSPLKPIIQKFIDEEDRTGKVRYQFTGYHSCTEDARNEALKLVPPETTHLMVLDGDEFYLAGDWMYMRERLAKTMDLVEHYSIMARCFYFDFRFYKEEPFAKIWRYYPGIRFFHNASLTSRGFGISQTMPGVKMFHYSYVSPEWTKTKGCINNDCTIEQYWQWWENVYSRFDGSNLQELYEKNGGGIHVFGGGPLSVYEGDHPAELNDHPLRHWRWEGPAAR